MLRPGLAADRRADAARAPMLRQAQAVASAEVAASSGAAAVTEAVDAAVTGDIVNRSPYLKAKLEEIDNRINQIAEGSETQV